MSATKGIRNKPRIPQPVKDKKYKYLWSKAQNEDVIKKAWKNLRKGKTKREGVKAIEANFADEVKKMQKLIRDTVPEHPEQGYMPPKVRKTKVVHEHGKRRTAHLADIHEQWYFHILVEVLKPIILRRLNGTVCGCVPGRGAHSGKKMLERQIRKGIKYFIKGDVRHFYDNLRIKVVMRMLRRDISDERFLYLIAKIYMYRHKGILIGLYISPWIANYALVPLDEILDRTEGIEAVRYVDDIVVTGNNKRILHTVRVQMQQILGKLRLKLKRTFQVCRFDYLSKKTRTDAYGNVTRIRVGRDIDFMGFRFYRDRTIIRKRIMLSATRTARRLHKAKEAGRRYYARSVRGMVSKMGWFSCTDSYDCYLANVKPYVDIRKLKRIISKLDKEDRKNARMEERNLLNSAA